MRMIDLAYVHNRFCPISEAMVSVEDRGFQFGDGIYEVIAVYGGKPFLLDRHLARLLKSAAAIELTYDFKRKPLEPIIAEGLTRAAIGVDAMVYIQLTRGVAPRSHAIPEAIEPTLVLTFRALPTVSDELRRRGASLITTPDIRWANCYVKAITLLPNVLAKNEAMRKGHDDAIFVTDSGEVRECTSANLFMVNGDELVLPTRDASILHGVTQGFLIECAGAIGLKIAERSFGVDTMMQADELILSSTTAEVLGITSVDDKPIANGRVGAVTQRLFDEFRSRSRALCRGSAAEAV